MIVGNIKEEHMDMIESWYSGYSVEPPEREILPSTGKIAKDGDTYTGSVWLYKARPEDKIAVMEFCITNPSISRKQRTETINLLSEACEKDAKDSGLIFTLVIANINKLKQRLISNGYMESVDNISTLTKGLV